MSLRARKNFAAPVPNEPACMICFRHTLKNFSVPAREQFLTHCVFASSTSTKCTLCERRHKECAQPAAGMEGDTTAVSIYLDWVGPYYAPVLDAQGNPAQNADGSTIYQFPEPLREDLAAAALRLCAGFEAAEKQHRAVWGTSGTKKKRSQDNQYRAWVDTRRTYLLGYYPRPGLNADMAVACRLRAGDVGFPAWSATKRAFCSDVEAALQQHLAPARFAADWAQFPSVPGDW
ncbi:hypothetical protein F4779DRAFT_614382 [Xylariaceae sp. FL0662B]|nr:hypothetical protein F4779DRAFT_618844 [Xylariaceae sp. FL0662B]KAI0012658.1 hypothetical protein F4779DRAFT_614382 [Xylariaceae sp. FL0662B]